MTYYTNIYSPETYQAFMRSTQRISGFKKSQENMAWSLKVGDRLLCYLTKFSRWVGILEVESGCYEDSSPLFLPSDDPYIFRVKVKPIVFLPRNYTLPIHLDMIWSNLSFTKKHSQNSALWTGKVRQSLNKINTADGTYLESKLIEQKEEQQLYEIDEAQFAKHLRHQVRGLDKVVSVAVPDGESKSSDSGEQDQEQVRKSYRVQASVARLGAKMGFRIWLPKPDRKSVLKEWNAKPQELLEVLPLNYDESTLKTIENIDVIWLKRRSIARAFEIEHSTAVYSGILRMADLLALQPNMNINLHIVAPDNRRDKVFQELKRPVFSLLESGPLYEKCTYLSYDTLDELLGQKHLEHLSDSVIKEYAEVAE